jgi:hypothetical protein
MWWKDVECGFYFVEMCLNAHLDMHLYNVHECVGVCLAHRTGGLMHE